MQQGRRGPGVILISLSRRDDAMDGIADVGSVVGRVAGNDHEH
jgi:hypothetical protein